MTTLKLSLVYKVRAQTRGAIAVIVINRAEEGDSEGDNPPVDLIRRIASSKVMSSRSMAQIENTGNDAVMCNDVVGRVGEKVARS